MLILEIHQQSYLQSYLFKFQNMFHEIWTSLIITVNLISRLLYIKSFNFLFF